MAGGSEAGLPARSLEQRLRALQHANEIRSARAALKRELAAGERQLDTLLLEVPAYARGAKIYEVLLSVPKVGPSRARQLLLRCKISETRTLGGLSERQRSELITYFRR